MELCLDQFGSLLSGPDSVGDVVVKLNPSKGAGLRSISLLDLDDEGTTIDHVLPNQRPLLNQLRPWRKMLRRLPAQLLRLQAFSLRGLWRVLKLKVLVPL